MKYIICTVTLVIAIVVLFARTNHTTNALRVNHDSANAIIAEIR